MPPVPFPALDDTVRVVFDFSHENGSDAACIFHARRLVRTGNAITLAEVNAVRLAVDTEVNNMQALMSPSWVLHTITVVAEDQVPGLSNFSTYNLPGTRAGNPLPSQIASIVSFTSDQPGRRGRGRNFWPFGTESDTTAVGSLWDSGFATSCAAWMDDVATALEALVPAWNVAVASHTYGTVGVASQFACDTTPDIQRRRRP